ncbi:hypothetical protein V2J09_024138 [Rumex salicifolius]
MRAIAAQLFSHLRRRRPNNLQSRNFSTSNPKDELSLEEDAERKIGWVLKLFFAGTAGAVAYNIFPYMGDNLIQQSVSLLQVKDPLFKRVGASRLTRFAVDDERRKKIVELGGVQDLVNMLTAAKDDKTRKEALKALNALSYSDEVLGDLYHAGALSAIESAPKSEDVDIVIYKTKLLKRFQDMSYDVSSGTGSHDQMEHNP